MKSQLAIAESLIPAWAIWSAVLVATLGVISFVIGKWLNDASAIGPIFAYCLVIALYVCGCGAIGRALGAKSGDPTLGALLVILLGPLGIAVLLVLAILKQNADV